MEHTPLQASRRNRPRLMRLEMGAIDPRDQCRQLLLLPVIEGREVIAPAMRSGATRRRRLKLDRTYNHTRNHHGCPHHMIATHFLDEATRARVEKTLKQPESIRGEVRRTFRDDPTHANIEATWSQSAQVGRSHRIALPIWSSGVVARMRICNLQRDYQQKRPAIEALGLVINDLPTGGDAAPAEAHVDDYTPHGCARPDARRGGRP
jgi:hypothetical protein